MRTLTPFLSNSLWISLSRGHYRRFQQALGRVEEVQRRYLWRLLHANAKTRYGKRYNFVGMSSVEDFRQTVPLTDYEDYLPYIEEIAQGEAGVLTADPVILFQPSSGTSSPSKLIPYTRSLKAEFQHAIAAWVVSLFKRKPELSTGFAYWSLSPPTRQAQYYGQVLIGFDDDAEYLGFLGKQLYAQVSAVPQKVASLHDTKTFLSQTLVYLLAAENLTLISVWSPTFLLLLLRHLIQNRDETIKLLAGSRLPRAEPRAQAIRNILCQEQRYPFQSIWPKLALISCWTRGPSETYANEVQKHFPDVELQGKGLVATEAFVSLPFVPDHDPVLAIDSHFFEFRDLEGVDIRLAHELREGGVYSVIVSTGGGLYRYQLGDLVKVTGFIGETPTLRFVAKETVSDLFGEKLHPDHVQHSAVEVFSMCSLKPSFFLLAPSACAAGTVAYSLFLYATGITTEQAKFVRDALENCLRENFHYAHCRNLGQLGPLQLFLIDEGAGAPEEIYMREMQRRGLKLGDIKPTVLDSEMGWERRLPGRFISTAVSSQNSI